MGIIKLETATGSTSDSGGSGTIIAILAIAALIAGAIYFSTKESEKPKEKAA